MIEPGTALTSQSPASPPAITEGPGALLSAIVGMARDPTVDVAKLDALLHMQERMEAREAEREFAAAFGRLSADLPRVKKNGTIDLGVDKQSGKARGQLPFARWEDVDTVIRPIMTREGFTLSFDSEPRPGEGGGLIVTGKLMHRDGHVRTASIPLALDTGPGRNNLQAQGSTLSYGKRYCAEMLLNIVREGEDDDGKRGSTKFITPEQVEELVALCKQAKRQEMQIVERLSQGTLHAFHEIEVGPFFLAVKGTLEGIIHQQSRKSDAKD
jgi:hypothetical protein